MPNIYIVKCATSGKRLGVVLESCGSYLSHPFAEGEDTSNEAVLNAVRSAGAPPDTIFDLVGRDIERVGAAYAARNAGDDVELEHIGVL